MNFCDMIMRCVPAVDVDIWNAAYFYVFVELVSEYGVWYILYTVPVARENTKKTFLSGIV
jgi:hypothetical protein